MEDLTGKILNERYRVEEKLGEGGMAYIYKAVDTKLERPVVLKVLKEEMAKDPEFLGRFKREAQSVAKLSHPNILTVYDIGEENGINYIVMEYFEAASLKDITKGKLLPFNKIYDIAAKILDALSYAHENGIVHRDIKPHNILINQDNVLKVTDFGIAKAFTSDTLTSTGSILGSVHYFSPEQAQGKSVDETSDIYSLGVMLYELAAGKLPFEGDTPVAVALKHVQESPLPPMEVNPSIPPAFEKIILKAIEKDPGKRYRSASEMMKDIAGLSKKIEAPPVSARVQEPTLIMKPSEELRRSLKSEEVPASVKGLNAGWWVLVIILILAIAGGGYFYWTRYLQEIVVPDVTRLDKDKAETLLNSKGLKLVIKQEIYDERLPAGIILKQEPEKGFKVKWGAVIAVIVSKGKESVQVPNLVGLNIADARSRLASLGLVLQIEKEADNPGTKAGSVLSQRPEPGAMAAPRSTVYVVVSKGEGMVKLPDLTGLSRKDAEAALKKLGLDLKVIGLEPNAQIPANAVISQEPFPGEEMEKKGVVKVVISTGLESYMAPNITGMTLDEAQKFLRPLDITLEVEGDIKTSDAQIVEQNPKPHNPIPDKKIVVRCVKTVIIPEVSGKKLEDAKDIIEKAGLKVGNIRYMSMDDAPKGAVLEQEPQAGIEVPAGTAVNLTVNQANSTPSPSPTATGL